MEKQNGHVHIDEEDVSGGSKEGVVRWVLLGGLVLAVLLLSVVWIVPALMTDDGEGAGNVSSRIQATENADDNTDSIVTDLGDDADAAPAVQTGEEDGLETIEN